MIVSSFLLLIHTFYVVNQIKRLIDKCKFSSSNNLID